MNTQTDTLTRVTNTLRGILPKSSRDANIEAETELQALGMDSINFLEFLLALEDEFELRLTDDALRLKAVLTVRDSLELVEHSKGESPT